MNNKNEMTMEIYRLAISTLLLLAVIIWFGMFWRGFELLNLDKIDEAFKLKAKMDTLTYVVVFLLGMNMANYINKL